MTHYDAFGYPLTLSNKTALDPWNATVQAFLAHDAATPAHLAKTLAADPDLALAHMAKGFFMLLLGRRELVETANTAHRDAAAIAAAGGATERERVYLGALGAYLAGDLHAAADRLDAALGRYRRDALMMKLVHAIRFILGDAAGMRRSVAAVASAYDPDHPAIGYLNGCYAFALEETGAYTQAEKRGRDALSTASNDAWGLHAVAHVYDMTNRTTEGVAWIARQESAWAHCSQFAYHVCWHLALFHLDRGEYGRVLALYDSCVRKDQTDDYRDISNGASLLMRLELEGVDVGDRWEEMAAFSAGRTDDGCVVFADLHYLLALNGAAREDAAARLLGQMRASAARRAGSMGAVYADPGLAAGEGLMRFAAGDYAGAHGLLAAARARMPRIGGSHAQRDVFERIGIEAALRAGLLTEAQSLIQHRMRARGAFDRYAETRLARISELREAA